jgi:hypothetical protein
MSQQQHFSILGFPFPPTTFLDFNIFQQQHDGQVFVAADGRKSTGKSSRGRAVLGQRWLRRKWRRLHLSGHRMLVDVSLQ